MTAVTEPVVHFVHHDTASESTAALLADVLVVPAVCPRRSTQFVDLFGRYQGLTLVLLPGDRQDVAVGVRGGTVLLLRVGTVGRPDRRPRTTEESFLTSLACRLYAVWCARIPFTCLSGARITMGRRPLRAIRVYRWDGAA